MNENIVINEVLLYVLRIINALQQILLAKGMYNVETHFLNATATNPWN